MNADLVALLTLGLNGVLIPIVIYLIGKWGREHETRLELIRSKLPPSARKRFKLQRDSDWSAKSARYGRQFRDERDKQSERDVY
jgi:hypothetical protein